MHDPLGKAKILAGGCQKQVLDQHAVVGAGGPAGGQHPANVQKQNAGVLVSYHIHHERFSGDAGIGFRKDLSWSGMAKNAAVSQQVIPLNGHTA